MALRNFPRYHTRVTSEVIDRKASSVDCSTLADTTYCPG